MTSAHQLICNGCLAPIELGLSFTWYMGKPYHNACTVNQAVITRAEADRLIAEAVAAEREACAQWCDNEADECEDARKWSDLRTQYAKDCKAAAFALRNAAWTIRARKGGAE